MKSENPLVSVCMPLFNTENYVEEAISGILNQTYTNLELIICDNNSTDKSLHIVEKMRQKDRRIKVVRNRRNLGYAGNLHKVTTLAKGEFMIVHCADDLSERTGIEKMIRQATSPDHNRDCIMVITDTNVVDSSGQPTSVMIQDPQGYGLAPMKLKDYKNFGKVVEFSGMKALATELPRFSIVGWMGATLYSRKLFESIEGVYNGLLYTPDLQLNYHLLSRDPKVIWIQESLFSWRFHEGGNISQAQGQAVPKLAWDMYTYTFHFPADLLKELGVEKKTLERNFVDLFCLRKALEEIRAGSMMLAFRHLCIGLSSYPGKTVANIKFYLCCLGVLTGPFGRMFAKVGYRLGIWRMRYVR